MFLCQDLTNEKNVCIIVVTLLTMLKTTMSDNTFLDYLDVILPTTIEQDDLKQLAEQDFKNLITNI